MNRFRGPHKKAQRWIAMSLFAALSLFVIQAVAQQSDETTEKGVIVIQTSTDTETVAALQQHAAEVSDLVQGGMAAMHSAMMKNGGGMMPGGMRGGMMGSAPNGKTAPNPQ